MISVRENRTIKPAMNRIATGILPVRDERYHTATPVNRAKSVIILTTEIQPSLANTAILFQILVEENDKNQEKTRQGNGKCINKQL